MKTHFTTGFTSPNSFFSFTCRTCSLNQYQESVYMGVRTYTV